ncbi:MAG: hypothetical protein Q9M91_03510 [Candidatus Dojkabacteria bacterium]|nr:hypothetical protein [Candidatus Dojkabacteria bacterium]MDQ7020889.1 hypothetical protein [Candidatus Dojkabacteria bacterium]
MITNQKQLDENWILVSSDKDFTCDECGNEVDLKISSIEGLVDADFTKIKSDLEAFPTKIIYGVCPICGMEYVFHLVDGNLYVEPSQEEK